MAALVAVELDEQVGAAVDDGGGLSKVGGGVDHAEDFDDSLDLVQVADFLFKVSQEGEAAAFGGLVALLDGQVFA